MILFFGDGRLGNQIFQYSFIKSIEDCDHKIVTWNFEDILNIFGSSLGVKNVSNRFLRFAIKQLGLPFLNVLAKARLITSYKVDTHNVNGYDVPGVTYTKRKGVFPVVYIYECFAQSEKFFKKSSVNNLTINDSYIEEATRYLGLIPDKYNKVFVHVRRGDYINYTIFGKKGVSLPVLYYKDRIQWFDENIENPFFVFLTDDAEFVECCFNNVSNKVISRNSMFVDFTIITMCEYGVMSNSSFSWWAAYMMKNRKKVFAPKYWLGWKSGIEFPNGVTPGFSEVVEVRNENFSG